MKIAAVTACHAGVAFTYLAAEALENAAKVKGIEIKVETQSLIGVDNRISMEEANAADIIVLTNDAEIGGTERFEGKPVFKAGISDVVKNPGKIINEAIAYVKSRR